jgi:hypothetical protein
MRGHFLLPLLCLSLSALLPACSGETAPLVLTPHAILISEDKKNGGDTIHVLLSDVPLTCADARYLGGPLLGGGVPPGARFKAVLGMRRWKVGALDSTAEAALFDDEGVVSTYASGVEEPGPGVKGYRPWGSFELLTAPRAKGEVARLRGSADGAFSVYARRPLSEEYGVTRFTTEEPKRQAFSFSSDMDLTLCSDIVETK